jgi:hypothetical protein
MLIEMMSCEIYPVYDGPKLEVPNMAKPLAAGLFLGVEAGWRSVADTQPLSPALLQ